MEILSFYILAAGSILVIILTICIILSFINFLFKPSIQFQIFKNLIYLRLYLFISVPRYKAILQAIYIARTISSNIIGVNTLKDASIRATRLLLANFILLFFLNYLGYAAYIIRVLLRSIVCFYGLIAIIAIIESIFHIVTILIIKLFSFKKLKYLYSILIGINNLYYNLANAFYFQGVVTLTLLILILLIRRYFYKVFLKTHVLLVVVTIISIYQYTTTIISKVVLIVPSATFRLIGVFQIGRIFYYNIPPPQVRDPQRLKTISFLTLNDYRPKAL